MRLLNIFKKNVKELSRDFLIILLITVSAPALIVIYKLAFFNEATTCKVIVLTKDLSNSENDKDSYDISKMINTLKEYKNADGKAIFKVTVSNDRSSSENTLKKRDADMMLVIPEGLSAYVNNLKSGTLDSGVPITFVADVTNPYYPVNAALVQSVVEQYLQERTGKSPLLRINEEALGMSDKKNSLDAYIPGLLILSIIMLLFFTAMSVTKEIESGGLRRLKLSHASSFDVLGGISLSNILIGLMSILLTFLTALAVGYKTNGSILIAILFGSLTTFSIIGIGLIIACFAKTVLKAFIFANFPMLLLMFFSGSIFPMPKIVIAEISGQNIGLFDILPPTHAVSALNKVLTYGSGFSDVIYEFIALTLLSFIYFFIGVWLFKRTQMKAV